MLSVYSDNDNRQWVINFVDIFLESSGWPDHQYQLNITNQQGSWNETTQDMMNTKLTRKTAGAQNSRLATDAIPNNNYYVLVADRTWMAYKWKQDTSWPEKEFTAGLIWGAYRSRRVTSLALVFTNAKNQRIEQNNPYIVPIFKWKNLHLR